MKSLNRTSVAGLAMVIAASLAAISPNTSHAVDEKILPGSICQPTSVDTSATRMFYSGGSVVNFVREEPGKFSVTRLHCPLVRDIVKNRWKYVYVRVRDNSNTAAVVCTASNYKPYGDSAISITRESGTSFTGLVSLAFGRPSSDFDHGAFHVYCQLPGNSNASGNFSAIHSIRLVEE